jgi:intracellular sulfur oxidation DsrE/DsrF family protein
MQPHGDLEQLTLHAFVDQQLAPEQGICVLAAMEADPAVREQICRLRRAKDWMRTGFADAQSQYTGVGPKPRRNRLGLAVAASLMALAFATGGALVGYGWGERQPPLLGWHEDPQHILLHLDDSRPATFAAVLDYAEAFLADQGARGNEVDVVANAGGIDLMRAGGSPYAERVKQLSQRYHNLHFIACANAIRNLRKQGVQVTVLNEVNAGETAVDHIVKRLRSGWSYIKVSDLPGI